ncbi:MAG: HAD hydrolase-like protein [Archangium sp.]|nr:HAD hydrolase-like protein [Archangium sp.]MDP3574189.1 HAD hydrolase-like protein [Archangium sp.]
MNVIAALSPRDFDAVLFDLDGVLTRTASVHASAWKKLFDSFLEQRARRVGAAFVPFDLDVDYARFVDGKPRLDGVRDFLASRGIELRLGRPGDGPEQETVHGLGSQKDHYFLGHVAAQGVEAYEAAISLVRKLRARQIKTAVVSSSRNCAQVLKAAGLTALFDTRVDGLDVEELGLEGKPAWSRRARWWWRTPSPASRRAGPASSGWSSASIAWPTRRRSARPARTSW